MKNKTKNTLGHMHMNTMLTRKLLNVINQFESNKK